MGEGGLSCDTRSGGQRQNRCRAEVADHPRRSRSRNQDQAGGRRGVRCEQAADQGDPANPPGWSPLWHRPEHGFPHSILTSAGRSYLMRERLEPLLLRMAMPTHTAESFVEFEASALRVEAATSPGEFLECDHDFHQALMAGRRRSGSTTRSITCGTSPTITAGSCWPRMDHPTLSPGRHLRRAPHDPPGRHRRRCRIRRGDVGVAYPPHQKARRTLPRGLHTQPCGWTRADMLSSTQP